MYTISTAAVNVSGLVTLDAIRDTVSRHGKESAVDEKRRATHVQDVKVVAGAA